MNDPEFAWPRAGTEINPPVDAWPHRAILHTEYRARSSAIIAGGYRSAAELIHEAIEEGRGPIDVLAGPLVFNWRHHIEVHLKANLEYMRRAAHMEQAPNLGHDLLRLWAGHQNVYARFDVELSKDDRAAERAARSLLGQLHALDPGSFHFRYPVDRSGGELRVPDELNVVAFHRAMLALSNYLGAVIDHLDAALEPQREFEAELRAEFLAEMRDELGP